MLHWRILLFIARMLILTPTVGWAAYAAMRYWDKITSTVGIGVISILSVIVGFYVDHKATKNRKMLGQ